MTAESWHLLAMDETGAPFAMERMDILVGARELGAREVFGRGHELDVVERCLDAAAHVPNGLLIVGDVGAGKSTLWREALRSATRRGCRVLSARPLESEATLALAGLGDLLRDALAAWDGDLPPPQSRALRAAVLLEDPHGVPPDQLAVSLATLGILKALARQGPVLVAIDDVQWLDRPTVRVLEFVLRRLRDESLAVVIASRPPEAGALPYAFYSDVAGQRPTRLDLTPLDADALDEIFRLRLKGSFPRPILTQIAAASGGNPMFALEIARGVQAGEIHARPGERLPVPRTLDAFIRHRLSSLSTEARELLFAAASVPDPTVELIARLDVTSDPLPALDAAVAAGIIEVSPARVIDFCHPIFGSMLYHGVVPARRRELHARLAALVSSPHERARHLSMAATGPDSGVASSLDAAAQDAASRGALDAAADLSEQAYAMTPDDDPVAGDRRRVEAAEHHFAAGDTARAQLLLESVVAQASPGPARGDALRRLAKVRYRRDSCSVAAELLTQALEDAGEDTTLRAGLERDLAWAVTLSGDVREAAEHAGAALALVNGRPGDPLLPELLAAKAMSDLLAGQGVQREVMQRSVELERPSPQVPIEWRPTMVFAMMLRWSEDLPGAQARFADLRAKAMDAGDETSLPFLLAQMSEAETLGGDWVAALEHAEAAHALALQTDQEPVRAVALHARALAQAHLGLVDAARASAREGLELSKAAGSVVWMVLNQSVAGFIELSLDDAEAAHGQLGPLSNWADVIGLRDPGVLRFIPDTAEALVALGQLDKAERLLQPFAADAARLRRPAAQLAAARAGALHLAASGDVAGAARGLGEVLQRCGPDVYPFERARALLALGTIQRRSRRRAAARASLQAAATGFRALGARLWLAKVEGLLGGPTPESSTRATSVLTPAERRVAGLVAAGSSNQAAADRLFVSVRAVEVHLTSIYRKLGIHSRTELAGRIARERQTVDDTNENEHEDGETTSDRTVSGGRSDDRPDGRAQWEHRPER